eukprot:scpid94928/ scgid14453/ 
MTRQFPSAISRLRWISNLNTLPEHTISDGSEKCKSCTYFLHRCPQAMLLNFLRLALLSLMLHLQLPRDLRLLFFIEANRCARISCCRSLYSSCMASAAFLTLAMISDLCSSDLAVSNSAVQLLANAIILNGACAFDPLQQSWFDLPGEYLHPPVPI